jgi:hypothetical protein
MLWGRSGGRSCSDGRQIRSVAGRAIVYGPGAYYKQDGYNDCPPDEWRLARVTNMPGRVGTGGRTEGIICHCRCLLKEITPREVMGFPPADGLAPWRQKKSKKVYDWCLANVPAEQVAGSLTEGQLNAVRAAFKAGVRRSAIARHSEFHDVRKVRGGNARAQIKTLTLGSTTAVARRCSRAAGRFAAHNPIDRERRPEGSRPQRTGRAEISARAADAHHTLEGEMSLPPELRPPQASCHAITLR